MEECPQSFHTSEFQEPTSQLHGDDLTLRWFQEPSTQQCHKNSSQSTRSPKFNLIRNQPNRCSRLHRAEYFQASSLGTKCSCCASNPAQGRLEHHKTALVQLEIVCVEEFGWKVLHLLASPSQNIGEPRFRTHSASSQWTDDLPIPECVFPISYSRVAPILWFCLFISTSLRRFLQVLFSSPLKTLCQTHLSRWLFEWRSLPASTQWSPPLSKWCCCDHLPLSL